VYKNSIQAGDTLIIILDVEVDANVELLIAKMRDSNIKVIVNRQTFGLSVCRNMAVENCKTEYMVFIDDDVVLTADVVDAIRLGFGLEYEIVGVRIYGPVKEFKTPWYISAGQFHYLAIHNPKARSFNTWGACMGVNISFAKNTGVKFREELGRKGNGLQSGDDTTFLREMKANGAKEMFVDEVAVYHCFDTARLSLSYMLRRAYWQGRSEFRRGDSINGLKKEWGRFFETDTSSLKKIFLAFLYIVPIIVGVWKEMLLLAQSEIMALLIERLRSLLRYRKTGTYEKSER